MGVNLGYMSMLNIFDAGEPSLGFTNITCWGQFDVLACLFLSLHYGFVCCVWLLGVVCVFCMGYGNLFCSFQVR